MSLPVNNLALKKLTWFIVGVCLFSAVSVAQPLPEDSKDRHLGVASCSNSVCHGKVAKDATSTVWLNEYRVWLREDYHSRAYRTLLTDQSKAIARKMGIGAAHTAKVCLDCHADNVPVENRGRRFQISDGVSCEACHGGSERWIESHTEPNTLHSDNLAKGMYPTEDAAARAKLCLSCHLGTQNKFATHLIMGAGHPRLSFELETFTANQPAHYDVDADYKSRKGHISSVNMWLAGLALTGKQTVELLQSQLFTASGLVPELSFFDCHACHHPMSDIRWEPQQASKGLKPGTVRLNDASLAVLVSVLEYLDKPASTKLLAELRSLHQSAIVSRSAVQESAASIEKTLETLAKKLVVRTYTKEDMRKLRKSLLDKSSSGEYRDFTSAEQVFLAVETLSLSLGQSDKYGSILDKLFATVENEDDFVPRSFAVVAGNFSKQL